MNISQQFEPDGITRARKYRAFATGEIECTFEDLPLVRDNGIRAALVSGQCRVSYYEDEGNLEWFVHEIFLDGFHKDGERGVVEVERFDRLYIPIWTELTDEGSFKDHIQMLVEEAAQ